MNKNLIIAGVITVVISFIILMLLSIWIGAIGLLVGIGLLIGGCINSQKE